VLSVCDAVTPCDNNNYYACVNINSFTITGEKSQKVTRGSHRNDVSPLTQGLRYRAACDDDSTTVANTTNGTRFVTCHC